MKSKKLLLGLSLVGVLTLAGCAKTDMSDPDFRKETGESAVYDENLANFKALAYKAQNKHTADERLVAYAQAEAYLLDSAVMQPTTTKGGNLALTRRAYHSHPFASVGVGDDKIGTSVVIKPNASKGQNFIKKADYDELKAAWEKGKATQSYDPVAILEGKGYSVWKGEEGSKYQKTFTTAPVTLDILNTSEQSDTEILANCIDGLVEYDKYGTIVGNVSNNVPEPVEVKEGETTYYKYTYNLRNDVKWVNSQGQEVRAVKAQDFVDGFQHMMDAQAGLEYLVDGVIVGAHEYLNGEITDMSKVGIKAVDDTTLEILVEHEETFFNSRLTYSCFMPLNKEFFIQKGGALGMKEFAEAKADEKNYLYGKASDPTSMLYNGAYYLKEFTAGSKIVIAKNDKYFNKDSINFREIVWIYDDGSNPTQTYQTVCNGEYVEMNLLSGNGTLELAKNDGNLAAYGFNLDTTSTTYLAGYNLLRGTWTTGSVKSTQSKQQKIDTNNALRNQNFRKALAYAWDRVTWNASTVGQDAAKQNIRNIYTKPNFTKLNAEYTDADYKKTFAAGTSYGEVIQYYLDQLGTGIKVDDGQDGWYNKDKAVEYMKKAVEELKKANKWNGKVCLDVTYYGASTNQKNQANSYKKLMEGVLGDYIEVRLNNAATLDDFYACGYRASSGQTGNFDVFYGSGWGPDYEDVSSYVDTFLPEGEGYMTKIIGLF